MDEKSNACKMAYLKRSLKTPRHTWVNNIKTELQDIEWDGMNWIQQAQNSGK
jgi:late competence protein required for DNA uptake (superfamily II DNA/RNA helicase)